MNVKKAFNRVALGIAIGLLLFWVASFLLSRRQPAENARDARTEQSAQAGASDAPRTLRFYDVIITEALQLKAVEVGAAMEVTYDVVSGGQTVGRMVTGDQKIRVPHYRRLRNGNILLGSQYLYVAETDDVRALTVPGVERCVIYTTATHADLIGVVYKNSDGEAAERFVAILDTDTWEVEQIDSFTYADAEQAVSAWPIVSFDSDGNLYYDSIAEGDGTPCIMRYDAETGLIALYTSGDRAALPFATDGAVCC